MTEYEFMRPLSFSSDCQFRRRRRPGLAIQASCVNIMWERTTVSFISFRWFSQVLGGPAPYVRFLRPVIVTRGVKIRPLAYWPDFVKATRFGRRPQVQHRQPRRHVHFLELAITYGDSPSRAADASRMTLMAVSECYLHGTSQNEADYSIT
jgi:hypothetical protein